MSLFQIIAEINKSASVNHKLAVLEKHKDNELLKIFFKASLDPYVTYGIKQIPFVESTESPSSHLGEFLAILPLLAERKVTGHAAIALLSDSLSNLDEEDRDVAIRIIKRDPDCGVQEKTVNKVWKDLIPSYPCSLCSAYDKKLVDKLNWKAGIIIQRKEDGCRVNLINDNGVVTMRSRQGKLFDVHGRFDKDSKINYVIDGELLFTDSDGKLLPRKISNGLANKANKGTLSKEEASRSVIIAWDMIRINDFKNGECRVGYSERLETLKEWEIFAENIRVVETKIIHSQSEADEIFKWYHANGYEGAILKDLDMPWENKRSKKAVKLKAENETDLIIVGYIEGNDAISGLMGALVCETSDGKIKVNVGGGYSLKQRAQFAANYHNEPIGLTTGGDDAISEIIHPNGDKVLGSILPVTYNEVIMAENGTYSLFLPRATEGYIRFDKTVADKFEDVK